MPCTILIQTRETCHPNIIAIFRPNVRFRQVSIDGESSHCKETQSHLHRMVICDVVFQMVVETLIHLTPEIFYIFQQQTFGIFVQQIVKSVVSCSTNREQCRKVEITDNIFIVFPCNNIFHTFDSFVCVSFILGQQISPYQYVHVRLFSINNTTALTCHHSLTLCLIL